MAEDTTAAANTQVADAGTTATTTASTTQTDAAKATEGKTTTTTTVEAGKTEGEGAKDAKSAEQPVKDASTSVPEAYDLKAPEGTTLDAAGIEAFSPLFKEAGLSNEAAQKLVSGYAAYQGQLLTKQAETWLATAKADKDIGGDKFDGTTKMAQSAFAKWATPELKSFLETTGLGNHPELLRTFAKIGAASQEDGTFIKGSGGQGARSDAEVLYPNESK